MLGRLYGIEKEKIFIDQFFTRIKHKYEIDFPKKNYVNADVILSNPGITTDILVGNPPWMNFADLPEDYKSKIKPYFYKYQLIDNPQKLLLGSSRIDIAALILAIVINDNLNKNGNAYFFIPLSIFLNDGAHSGFRRCVSKNTRFAIKSIYDFGDYSVFKEVCTRYGVVHLQRDVNNMFPVIYKIKSNNSWAVNYAAPLHQDTVPLSICQSKKQISLLNNLRITDIPDECKPRQGVNTCGANEVFFFKTENALEHRFLFPLISKENFFETNPIPKRYIFLPYDSSTGRPLSEAELRKYPSLWNYLLKCKNVLIKRKGILINTWIKKNIWWALLGVGKYSFAPYKIAWNAYGQKTFSSKLFLPYKGKAWQGNQALHAYIPYFSQKDAKCTLSKLSNPLIEKYLLSFRMEGTCNWAQPGKMKKLFNISNQQQLSLNL